MRTAYIKTLYELADRDPNVIAVISDNGIIVYDDFQKAFPDRLLNVGIAEANMIALSSGLAERGKIPFAYTIGTFLANRANEFIRNDVCLQNKNVKMVGIGAGQSYSLLGPSHHSTEDIGCLRSFPNLVILSPASPIEVRSATLAAYEHVGPVYIRLGTNREQEIYTDERPFEIGSGILIKEGDDISVVATGSIVKDVLDAAFELEKEGISARVINMPTIKPLDEEIIRRSIDKTGRLITVEDHNIIGGLGSACAEVIAEYGKPVLYKRIGLRDFSHAYGTYTQVKEACGIGRESIKQEIRLLLNE